MSTKSKEHYFLAIVDYTYHTWNGYERDIRLVLAENEKDAKEKAEADYIDYDSVSVEILKTIQ